MFPPKPPAKNDADAVVEKMAEQDGDAKKEGDVDPAKKGQGDEAGKADSDKADKDKTDSAKSDDNSKTVTDPKSTDPNNQNVQPVQEEPKVPHQYPVLGSLGEDSPFRMMVTFNNQGASVHRIELVDHLESGQLRFRDLEDRFGYIGHFALSQFEGGCQVNTVGPGTPAQLAGVQVDDVIVGISGVSEEGEILTTTLEEYHQALSKSKIGSEISLRILRNESERTIKITTTDRPLETVRPEPLLPMDQRHPESFLLSIKAPHKDDAWTDFDSALVNGNWEVKMIDDPNEPAVEFHKDIDVASSKLLYPDGTEKSVWENGPRFQFHVVKRYRLMKLSEEQKKDRYSNFHLMLDVEIQNKSKQDISELNRRFSVQLSGPTGTQIEGWWYGIKIHGEATAIFYAAGPRDFVASSDDDSFKFVGLRQIFDDGIDQPPRTVWEPDAEAQYKNLSFAGVDSQYFVVAMIPSTPDGEPVKQAMHNVFYSPVHPVTKGDKLWKLADPSFRMYSNLTLESNQVPGAEAGMMYKQSYMIFSGPKEPQLLSKYGLGDTVTYGWFAWFSKPLVSLLHFFYSIIGNYGISIILLTLLVRACMVPISRKAALNAQMMQHLQPEMKKIADKYKDDLEKRSQAQRELFKTYNYNPFGGCMLMFLQLPVFLGLYRGLSVDVSLRDQPLIRGLEWCSNLAGPDQFFYWKDAIPIGWLTSETGFLGPYLNILPIITIVLFIVQQKLFTPPPTDEQQAMTQKMMSFMMIFIGVMFFKVPSGLCIYFITSSLWGIIERKALPKPQLDKSKLAPLPGDDSDTQASGDKKPVFGSTDSKKESRFAKAAEMFNLPNNQRTTKELSGDERKQRNRERDRRRKDRQRKGKS